MENNYYYEPAIKTVRKPFIHDETGTKIGEEIKTTYKICTTDCISKKQLINFLKHLIGETECAYDYKENEYKNSGKWNLLNEILDFVNKGGKDE